MNHVVKSKNDGSKRVIKGTSGFCVVDCNTKEKLGSQVCQNLIGRAPASLQSDKMSVSQNVNSIITNPHSAAFEKRSEKSNLFGFTLQTTGDSINFTLKNNHAPGEQ
jgi:hypothetical protein